MGCFSAQHKGRTHMHPTLKSLLHGEPGGAAPSSANAMAIFRARALHKLTGSHPRALSAPAKGDSSQDQQQLRCELAIRSSDHRFPLPLPPDDISSLSGNSSTASNFSPGGSSSSAKSNQRTSSSARPEATAAAAAVTFGACACSTAELCAPCQPLPLPSPPDSGAVLREFSLEELAGACQNFAPEFWIRDGGPGPVFRATVMNKGAVDEQTLEVAVTQLIRCPSLSLRKWKGEVRSLARLSHSNLCKVVGFSTEDHPQDKNNNFSPERLLVYEHMMNGSLDGLLYGRMEKAPLDWPARLKIAIGAAQGLAFLHGRAPRQILYRSFRTSDIQVDENFNAKLSDYGFAGELPGSAQDEAYSAPETLAFDQLLPKSNVWSFGLVLLELLTGRQNMDEMFPEEERNVLQWGKASLMDAKKLYLVMDPELKGRYATKNAKAVADLALRCMSQDLSARPSMREVVLALSSIPFLHHLPLSCTASDPRATMRALPWLHRNHTRQGLASSSSAFFLAQPETSYLTVDLAMAFSLERSCKLL